MEYKSKVFWLLDSLSRVMLKVYADINKRDIEQNMNKLLVDEIIKHEAKTVPNIPIRSDVRNLLL